MKSDTRRARMAALMAEGEDDELFELLPKEEPEKSQEEINAEETASREAESVLAFLRGEVGRAKYCKNCDGLFFTSYGNVAYCGDPCRAEALKKIGITWDFTKPLHERWGKPIPLVLNSEMIERLEFALNHILAAQDRDERISQPESSLAG